MLTWLASHRLLVACVLSAVALVLIFIDMWRPAPPRGIEYVPVIGRLRWGWRGARFIQEPADPGKIGLDVTRPEGWESRETQYVVLEAVDKRPLTNCVVGYWIPGQRWRFRANRPIPEARRIALKLRFNTQNFAVYTPGGEPVTLRVAGYYHNNSGRRHFLDAPEL